MSSTRPDALIRSMQEPMTSSSFLPWTSCAWMKSMPTYSVFQGAQSDSSCQKTSSIRYSIWLSMTFLSMAGPFLLTKLFPVHEILQLLLRPGILALFGRPADGDIGDHLVFAHAGGYAKDFLELLRVARRRHRTVHPAAAQTQGVRHQQHVLDGRGQVVRDVDRPLHQRADHRDHHRRFLGELGHFARIHEAQHFGPLGLILDPGEALLHVPQAIPGRHARATAHLGEVANPVARFLIAHDDEAPGLVVLAGRRPTRRLEDPVEQVVRHRIGVVAPDAFPAGHDVEDGHASRSYSFSTFLAVPPRIMSFYSCVNSLPSSWKTFTHSGMRM